MSLQRKGRLKINPIKAWSDQIVGPLELWVFISGGNILPSGDTHPCLLYNTYKNIWKHTMNI